MNVERIGEKRTIWKFTNASILQLMWKDLANNAQFEKSRMIGWHVNCDECGKFLQITHNLKIHKWFDDKSSAINVERFGKKCTIWKFTNDSMISQLQSMWKILANTTQFENSQIIGWQINCNECGKIWRTTPHLKTHKWSDDKVIANECRNICRKRLIWKFRNDLMTS